MRKLLNTLFKKAVERGRSRCLAKFVTVLIALAFLLLLLPGREAQADWSLNYDMPDLLINALTIYNGKLYAGTCCTGAIYGYDGTSWSLNANLDNGYVHSLAVFDNKLYAGTNYYEAGQNRGRVWVYDGTAWSISQDFLPDDTVHHVHSLAVFNGKLYAGTGDMGKIRVFDGTAWTEAFNTGQNAVWSFAIYNGKLYAATGQEGIIYAYDGTSWSVSYDSDQTAVLSLAVYNGKLYAGTGNGGIIYAYDGVSWLQSYDSGEQQIRSLATYNGKLYAGGLNKGIVYVYDETSWSVSYDSGEDAVISLATYNDRLYVGTASNGKIFMLTSPPTVNQSPNCSEAVPTLLELWPPNHQMVSIGILGVTDPDGDPVNFTITDITQDEPVNGLGDGNTSPDGEGVGTGTASVRAERAGTRKASGNGRVYEISFTASDGRGGECQGSVGVCVPHDQRPGHVCIDDGQIYDSTHP